MIVRAISSQKDRQRAATAARDNGHVCLAPTHLLESLQGEVRGFASIGAITTILFWSHTANDKFASCKFAKRTIELARSRGEPVVCLCTSDSPFAELMPGLGFELIGDAKLWKLKQ